MPSFFTTIFATFLVTIVRSLVHRSVAGGDSGELIAAITPPQPFLDALSENNNYTVSSSSSPSMEDEVLFSSSSSSSSSQAAKKNRGMLSSIFHHLLSAADHVGVAHPPGYPLYLMSVRFLVAVSYDFWEPGVIFDLVYSTPPASGSASASFESGSGGGGRITNSLFSSLSSTFLSAENIQQQTQQQQAKNFALLSDYLLRVNATSLVFAALTLLVVAATVIVMCRYQYRVNALACSIAVVVAVGAALRSETFLRYASEAEVFAMNQLIVALGFFAFVIVGAVAKINGAKNSSSTTTNNSTLVTFSSVLATCFCAFVLGLVLSHQHAALFVAAPIILSTFFRRAVRPLINVVNRNNNNNNSKVLEISKLIAKIWLPAILCFLIGCSPVMHIYRQCRQPMFCNSSSSSSSSTSFSFSSSFSSQTSLTPPLTHSWAIPCRRDHQEESKKLSSSTLSTSSTSIQKCVTFTWNHILRKHYGTFSMTSGSLAEQDEQQQKQQKQQKGKKQKKDTQNHNDSSSSSSSFYGFLDRIKAYFKWISHDQFFSIFCLTVFAMCSPVLGTSFFTHHFVFLEICFCVLFSGVAFSFFSKFNLSSSSSTNDDDDDKALLVYAHVHERMWLQSAVPLWICAGIAVMESIRICFAMSLPANILGFGGAADAAAPENVNNRMQQNQNNQVQNRNQQNNRDQHQSRNEQNNNNDNNNAVNGPGTWFGDFMFPLTFLFFIANISTTMLVVVTRERRTLLGDVIGGGLQPFRAVRAFRTECRDCAVAAFSIGNWRSVDLATTTNSNKAAATKTKSKQQSTKKKLTATKFLFTSGDLHFAPLLLLEPYLRIFSSVSRQQKQQKQQQEDERQSTVVWVDVEVGTRDWFTKKFLVNRLSTATPTTTQEDDANNENAEAIKVLNSDFYLARLNKQNNNQEKEKEERKNDDQHDDETKRFDVVKLVSRSKNLFSVFALELPEFTTHRQQLAKLGVEFFSHGPTYQLVVASSASSSSSSQSNKQEIWSIFTKIFDYDVWDSSIAAGFNFACRDAVRALVAADSHKDEQQQQQDENSIHGDDSSSKTTPTTTSPSTTSQIKFAWVHQVIDQCANAGKNKFVHLLTQLQQPGCVANSDTLAPIVYEKFLDVFKELLIMMPSSTTSEKVFMKKYISKMQDSSSGKNNFELFVNCLSLMSSRKRLGALMMPLIDVLKQVTLGV